VTFLDVATPMLGPNGKPRPELFSEDGLHMNERGYALWARVIAPVLLRDLGADAS
jgi:lysophospholipase L1-like esterase